MLFILVPFLISCAMQESTKMNGTCILNNKQIWNYIFSEDNTLVHESIVILHVTSVPLKRACFCLTC